MSRRGRVRVKTDAALGSAAFGGPPVAQGGGDPHGPEPVNGLDQSCFTGCRPGTSGPGW